MLGCAVQSKLTKDSWKICSQINTLVLPVCLWGHMLLTELCGSYLCRSCLDSRGSIGQVSLVWFGLVLYKPWLFFFFFIKNCVTLNSKKYFFSTQGSSLDYKGKRQSKGWQTDGMVIKMGSQTMKMCACIVIKAVPCFPLRSFQGVPLGKHFLRIFVVVVSLWFLLGTVSI